MLRILTLALIVTMPTRSKASESTSKLSKIEIITLEVVRQKLNVKIVVTAENLKRYESIAVERAEVEEGPYRQVKLFMKERIDKSTTNQIIDFDHYPLAVKHGGFYRIKTEEAIGVMRIFPGIPLEGIFQEAQISIGNFSLTKNATKNTAPIYEQNTANKNSTALIGEFEEITQGLHVEGENSRDIFDKYDNEEILTASADISNISYLDDQSITQSIVNNIKELIVSKQTTLAYKQNNKQDDDPLLASIHSTNAENYVGYSPSSLIHKNITSTTYTNFLKQPFIASKEIVFNVHLDKGFLESDITLDTPEKYFDILIEYAENKEGSYKPLKRFDDGFISNKFIDNHYTLMEPFYAPRNQKSLQVRLRLRAFNGDEYITKSTKISW
jgi:hypothetical protein